MVASSTFGTLPAEEEPRYDMPISRNTDSRGVPGEEEYLEIDENSGSAVCIFRFFHVDLLRLVYEKILLINSLNFWGDYRMI